jgi:hypothetical protein
MSSTTPASTTPSGGNAPNPAAAGDGKGEGGFFGKSSPLPGVADATTEMPGIDSPKAGAHPPMELEEETAVERMVRKREEAAKGKGKGKGPGKEALPPSPKGDETETDEERAARERHETAPDPAGEFEFAGQKWRDADHAEHSFRTLRGQFKAKAKLATEATSLANGWHEIYQRDVGTREKPGAYMQEITRLRTLLAQNGIGLEPGEEAPAGDRAPKGKKGKSFVESFDWKTYQDLAKEKGPEWAVAFLADSIDETVAERTKKIADDIRAEFEGRLSPFVDAHGAQAELQKATGFFGNMAQAKTDDNRAVYPEFLQRKGESKEDGMARIEVLTRDIARFWIKLPADIRYTPEGFHHAVLAYRGWKAGQVEEPGGESEESPSNTEQLLEEDTAAARARAALHSTRSGTPRAADLKNPEERNRSFVRMITEAGAKGGGPGFTA